MPNWSDPHVIEESARAFSSVIAVTLGVYSWEFLTTLSFEASFFTQPRRKWRVEHITYFACRYSFFVGVIMLTVLFHLTEKVNCQALARTAQVFGNTAIGTATLNILYRAWAISLRYPRIITVSLAIAEAGHWGILIWNMLNISSEWTDAAARCTVTYTNKSAIVSLYVYTMLFDFAILLMSIAGLWKYKTKTARTQIWELLRRQGIYYFLSSFIANVFPVVFIVISLNPVMDAMTSVPAACLTTIASCRAVIWLTTWVDTDGSGLSDTPEFPMTPPAPMGRRKASTKATKGRDPEGGVLTTVDVGLPSEIFAKTRRNDDDEGEQAMRSSSDDPSDFKSPASLSPHSPTHYHAAPATHPVILTLSDKGENQSGASASTIASSMHRSDTSPFVVAS